MGLRYANSPRLESSKTIYQFQGRHLVWTVKGYLTLGKESKDTASFALKSGLELSRGLMPFTGPHTLVDARNSFVCSSGNGPVAN